MKDRIRIILEMQNGQYIAKVEEAKRKTTDFGKSASTSTGLMQSAWMKGSVGVAAAIATMIASYKMFIKPAMAAEEALSKFNTIFKKDSADVSKWSEDLGNKIGRGSFELKTMASDMMALTTPMASTRKEAIAMSENMVLLAQDLSSFHDIPVEEALVKIRSGLVGEAEPMRALGIDVSDTSLKIFAFNNGITKSVDQMSMAEKSVLRYKMMIQGAGEANGDAARTVGSSTNQMRQFEDNIKEISRAIGDMLLPTLNSAITKFNEYYKAAKNNQAEKDAAATIKLIKDEAEEKQASMLIDGIYTKSQQEEIARRNKAKELEKSKPSATPDQIAAYRARIEKQNEIEYSAYLRWQELQGNKIAVLEANKYKELKAAEEIGANTAAINEYYDQVEAEAARTLVDQNIVDQVRQAQAEIDLKEQAIRAKMGLESAAFKGAQMFANAGAQLMSSQNKMLFKAGQIASVANIWMNVAVAIAKGYAQLGVFGGTAFAALMGTVGFVQTQNIMKQKPPQDIKNESASIAAPELPKTTIVPLSQGVFNVPRDMPAVIHQGESVMPKSWAESVRRGELGAAGGMTLVVNVAGSILDKDGFMNAVYDAMSDIGRRTGTTIFTRRPVY